MAFFLGCQTLWNNSTCYSCMQFARGEFEPMASTSNGCVTYLLPWLLMSAKTSQSDMTRVIWEKFGYSIATNSCAGPLQLILLARTCNCVRFCARVIIGGESCGPSSGIVSKPSIHCSRCEGIRFRRKPMSSQPSPPDLQASPSNATAKTNLFQDFVPTREYRRFVEFCEACRHYRYIGLCYGPPGIGKTLSARHFSGADKIEKHNPWRDEPIYGLPVDTVFYTTPVVNTPSHVDSEITRACDKLREIATGPIRRRAEIVLDTIRVRNEHYRQTHPEERGSRTFEEPPLEPTFREAAEMFEAEKREIGNPTRLVLIDEADRLRMASLEQVRSIFDTGTFGLILIGMPGIEKRMARYPQLYSRIGFVHEFRPLGIQDMRSLLGRHWAPVGVTLPDHALSEDAATALIRATGGNFRLLNRMLTQIERIVEINGLHEITKDAIEAARESLVIGQT